MTEHIQPVDLVKQVADAAPNEALDRLSAYYERRLAGTQGPAAREATDVTDPMVRHLTTLENHFRLAGGPDWNVVITETEEILSLEPESPRAEGTFLQIQDLINENPQARENLLHTFNSMFAAQTMNYNVDRIPLTLKAASMLGVNFHNPDNTPYLHSVDQDGRLSQHVLHKLRLAFIDRDLEAIDTWLDVADYLRRENHPLDYFESTYNDLAERAFHPTRRQADVPPTRSLAETTRQHVLALNPNQIDNPAQVINQIDLLDREGAIEPEVAEHLRRIGANASIVGAIQERITQAGEQGNVVAMRHAIALGQILRLADDPNTDHGRLLAHARDWADAQEVFLEVTEADPADEATARNLQTIRNLSSYPQVEGRLANFQALTQDEPSQELALEFRAICDQLVRELEQTQGWASSEHNKNVKMVIASLGAELKERKATTPPPPPVSAPDALPKGPILPEGEERTLLYRKGEELSGLGNSQEGDTVSDGSNLFLVVKNSGGELILRNLDTGEETPGRIQAKGFRKVDLPERREEIEQTEPVNVLVSQLRQAYTPKEGESDKQVAQREGSIEVLIEKLTRELGLENSDAIKLITQQAERFSTLSTHFGAMLTFIGASANKGLADRLFQNIPPNHQEIQEAFRQYAQTVKQYESVTDNDAKRSAHEGVNVMWGTLVATLYKAGGLGEDEYRQSFESYIYNPALKEVVLAQTTPSPDILAQAVTEANLAYATYYQKAAYANQRTINLLNQAAQDANFAFEEVNGRLQATEDPQRIRQIKQQELEGLMRWIAEDRGVNIDQVSPEDVFRLLG